MGTCCTASIRSVQLRTGVVLTPSGGALQKMIRPIQSGIGAYLGSGKQSMSWIHIEDLCNMYLQALNDKHLYGPYNATAPDHQTNKSFTKLLAEKMGKSIWLSPVPPFILQFMFGKMSNLLLQGSRTSSQKIEHLGFKYQFPRLTDALNDLLKL
jgi:uncharacterized protein (TIGR01777 family)